jgi:protoporphyrinogen oxidase
MKDGKSKTFGIVGGGILGMMLAHRLAENGQRAILFEAANELGGLASAWALGDVVWDKHYHVTLLSDSFLRALLSELGLAEDINWVETRTGFYTDGRLYSMSNTLEFLRFPPLGVWHKLRLGATIFYAARIKNWRRLERISVGLWLRRWSGEQTWQRIWLPLLRAKLGDNYEKASASFIWAIIARMYAARRTGLKKEMFGYVRGGYACVLKRFAEVLRNEGVDIQVGRQVRRVEPAAGKVAIEFSNGSCEAVDQAVLTMPGPLAARVCPSLSPAERAGWEGIQYQGIVCASLLLKKPLAGYYVTNITDCWVPFTAVIEMSALVDPATFGGRTLVYLPKYVPPDDPFFNLSDSEVEERFWAALARMYPHLEREDVLCFRVSRVRHVLALATLNYSERLPPMKTSVPGVAIVNSAHILNGTLNVNETVQLAEKAIPMLLAEASTHHGAGPGVPAIPSRNENLDARAESQPVSGPR